MAHRTNHRSLAPLMLSALLCCAWLAVGCSEKLSRYDGDFEAWYAADPIFRTDRLWRGGDAAYSVDLGNGRVLWLFGDSWVGDGPDDTRSGRKMVKNSIAIQEGVDPSQATIRFYWGGTGKEPGAFFQNTAEGTWLWPGPGQRVGNRVLLTFMRLTKTGEGPFGFLTEGSEARLLKNPEAPPTEWELEAVPLPTPPAGVKFGTGALLAQGGFLYAYVVVEPGNHNVHLARWAEADVQAMDLSTPAWWTGSAWSPSPNKAGVIAKDVQTEFSVTPGPDKTLWMVSVKGFGGTNIVARTAPAPEGPWSKPMILYRPPESGRKDILVYSAKAYPHDPDQGFVFTYCTNHLDFWTMAGDMSIYFPRFVRLL